MKPFEGYKSEPQVQKMILPAGCYVAAIKSAKVEGTEPDQTLKIAVDVIEGDYAGFYTRQFEQASGQLNLQYEVKYKGVLALQIPNPANTKRTHPEWDTKAFNNAMWCIEQSNPGYHWDWNEAGLKNKLVGINVREGTYNGSTYTKIGRFEVVNDVREGICKPMKPLAERTTAGTVPTLADATPVEDVELPF